MVGGVGDAFTVPSEAVQTVEAARPEPAEAAATVANHARASAAGAMDPAPTTAGPTPAAEAPRGLFDAVEPVLPEATFDAPAHDPAAATGVAGVAGVAVAAADISDAAEAAAEAAAEVEAEEEAKPDDDQAPSGA
jgi:hypothetical protein